MKIHWKVCFASLLLFAFLIPALAQDLEERVETLEMWMKEPPQYIKSYEGDKIKIGGELEFEFVKTQDDEKFPADDPLCRFQMDKVRFKAKVKARDDIEFKFKLDFEDIDEVELDEAYLTIVDIAPFDQEISLGLQDRFISDSIEKLTEGSPMARTAFWKDPDLGIQYKGRYNTGYWCVSFTNGLQLKEKEIGEDKKGRDEIIQDDDKNSDENNSKQVGIGLGLAPNLADLGFLDVLVFGYISKLSDDDLDFLDDELPGAPADNEDKTQLRFGANLAYTKDALEVYGQYVKAEDSFLLRHCWFVQASYKLDLDLRYLKAIQPLFRYGEYRTNQTLTDNKPLTWDRKRTTIALLNHIEERVILKLEYALNDEITGGDKPKNDEFLAQLEYKF
ncbi:hypothetical protein ES705_04031 [subsurface metagenome]|nr:hypothetical protein [Clostridia bacterium]